MEKENDLFDFSKALIELKNGKAVARVGWNGNGMFAVMSPGSKELNADNIWTKQLKDYAIKYKNGKMDVRPSLMLKTAQDDIAYWTPSCSDILADDWLVVNV